MPPPVEHCTQLPSLDPASYDQACRADLDFDPAARDGPLAAARVRLLVDLLAVAITFTGTSAVRAATEPRALLCLSIHLRTRLVLNPCAKATADTDAPGTKHFSTTARL
jgi:hypothetical protein